MGSRLALASLTTLALVLGSSRHALADAPEARAHYEKGLALYEAREFEPAVAEFSLAFGLDARAEYLFAWAQAERQTGDCASAVPLFRRYQRLGANRDQVAAAAQLIERCERGEPVSPATQPTTLPLPQAPIVTAPLRRQKPRPSPLPPPRPVPVARHWYQDPVGTSLTVAGIVSLGVGTALFFISRSNAAEAAEASDYDEYQRIIERAQSRRTLSLVGLGLGAGLVTAGVVRYLWWDPGNGTLGVHGRF